MKRQFGITASARLLSAGCQALSIILLARILTVQHFGDFALVFALQSTVFQIALLGLPTFILREYPRRAHREVGGAIRLNLLSSLVALIAGIAVSIVAQPSMSSIVFSVLLSVTFLIEKNVAIRAALQMARGEALRPALATTVPQVFGVVGVAIAFVSSYSAAPLLYVSARLAGAAMATIVTRGVSREAKDAGHLSLTETARKVWPMAMNGVVTTLVTFDTAIVGLLANAANVASYSAASKLILPVAIATSALSSSFMPKASLMDRRERSTALRRIILLALIVGVCVIPFALASQLLVVATFGAAYTAAAPVLAVLIFAIPALTAGPLLETYMQAHEQERVVAGLAIVYTVAALLAAAVGTALMGAVGAAAAVTVTNTVKVCVQLALIRRKERTHEAEGNNEADDSLLRPFLRRTRWRRDLVESNR